MEFGCWLAALVWASGGDGDVAGAGQQEPPGQREVGGELQRALRLPHVDQVCLGPAVCSNNSS